MTNVGQSNLSVVFRGATEVLAQEGHLARGCLFVPMPAPEPEPFAEVMLHLRSAWGPDVDAKGRVVQIVPGRGIAIALDDAAAAKRSLAAAFEGARAAGADAGEPATVTWGAPPEEPAAPAAETASEPEPDTETEPSGLLFDEIRAMPAQEKMRLAVHGDRAARQILMRDLNKTIQLFVLQNKRITIDEVRYLAGYRQAHPDVLTTIAANRDWTINPNIVGTLVRNPKTPTPTAVKLLEKLPMSEIRRLAKSTDVPRAVCLAARKKAVDA